MFDPDCKDDLVHASKEKKAVRKMFNLKKDLPTCLLLGDTAIDGVGVLKVVAILYNKTVTKILADQFSTVS